MCNHAKQIAQLERKLAEARHQAEVWERAAHQEQDNAEAAQRALAEERHTRGTFEQLGQETARQAQAAETATRRWEATEIQLESAQAALAKADAAANYWLSTACRLAWPVDGADADHLAAQADAAAGLMDRITTRITAEENSTRPATALVSPGPRCVWVTTLDGVPQAAYNTESLARLMATRDPLWTIEVERWPIHGFSAIQSRGDHLADSSADPDAPVPYRLASAEAPAPSNSAPIPEKAKATATEIRDDLDRFLATTTVKPSLFHRLAIKITKEEWRTLLCALGPGGGFSTSPARPPLYSGWPVHIVPEVAQ